MHDEINLNKLGLHLFLWIFALFYSHFLLRFKLRNLKNEVTLVKVLEGGRSKLWCKLRPVIVRLINPNRLYDTGQIPFAKSFATLLFFPLHLPL